MTKLTAILPLTFAAAAFLAQTTAADAQITDRQRPAEWAQLVSGARFTDRFLPMPAGKLSADTWGAPGVVPRYVDNGIEDRQTSYWGGNILRGADGKYHLFVCGWPESSRRGHHEWPNSTVFRAVSDNSIGPFKVAQTLGKGHNPEAFRARTGEYVVYVMGANYTADALEGPWKQGKFTFDTRDRRIVEGLSNLTFTQREDGSYLMVCRGGGVWFSQTGLTPYNQVTSGSVYPKVPAKIGGNFEDPVVWRDNVQYHLIVNDWKGRLAWYLRSKDGVNWVVDPGEAYTINMSRHANGHIEKWFKYERAKILQDKHGRAIQMNLAVIDVLKNSDKANDNHSSKNISIPLNPGLLLQVLNPEKITAQTPKILVKVAAEEGFDPSTDLDLASLRFGASTEVNFGRGSKLKGIGKSGADHIFVFDGAGSGITDAEFAPKLLGKFKNGKTAFGYSRLPGVTYIEPILSARTPEAFSVKDGQRTRVVIENFGQVASKEATLQLWIDKGKEGGLQLLETVKVPPLDSFGRTTVEWNGRHETSGKQSFLLTLSEDGKQVSKFSFKEIKKTGSAKDVLRPPVSSPNGKITFALESSDKLTFSVHSTTGKDTTLIENAEIALLLNGKTLGKNSKIISATVTSHNGFVRPVVPFKTSSVVDKYNQARYNFEGGFSLEVRAYDDGIAYRFVANANAPRQIDVLGETFNIKFPEDYKLHYQDASGRKFASCYEERYSHAPISKLNAWGIIMPVLADTGKGPKIFISETNLFDYPNTFFKKGEGNSLQAFYPPVPTSGEPARGRYVRAIGDAGYIARTEGPRVFPWRYFIITERDTQLPENTMNARLAPPSAIADTSWIKPGLAAWDWMNRGKPFGPEVGPYKRGVNTQTCKLYIDYAARNKIPYYIIDEGWSADPGLPQKAKAGLDLPEVVRYGKEKGVGVILWITYLGVHRDFNDDSYNLFEYFSKMGVVGFKIDFMDRSDQAIVNFYERAAAEAAKYKMIIELHGSYKPAGLEFKYPNVLSYEGVVGLENHLGCRPENSLWLPFMRNVCGPMSFTPGAMTNVQPDKTRGNFGGHWPTIGTRAHHVAYYVLFESGLQMISDSPLLFDKNPKCANFIYTTPVTWDETRVVEAEAGKYLVVLRRKGAKWWIGAALADNKQGKTFSLKLDFLPAGTFLLTSISDGKNAGEDANDYVASERHVSRSGTIEINLSRNGGFAARLEPAAR
ncbi:MAG: glycoside hydrolase family 97 catalytic domain-containing protein [Puniceicoccales bacterium]|nr:glycoside hydrolase family 97 catalytic domain-containing protein [Puniceicoccales bacterium]